MLTLEGLIAVVSLCLTAFSVGYAIGSNDKKSQKQPPGPDKLSGIFVKLIYVD